MLGSLSYCGRIWRLLLKEVAKMIYENLRCDICGIDKKETNHWFVAFEDKGALKLSAWVAVKQKRKVMKHLCGHRCVHRLIDVFLAGNSINQLSPDVSAKATTGAFSDQIDSDTPVN
jgi:hypothetical protein